VSYVYETEKTSLLTDGGQRAFIADRDAVLALLKKSGAIRMGEAMAVMSCGDSWQMLATMDRMVELGDVVEMPSLEGRTAGQDRVFVRK
jgi:hypothetical protein